MAKKNLSHEPDPKKIPDFRPDDLAEIKEFFDIFDPGNGVIDLQEMLDYLRDLRVHEKYKTVFFLLKKVQKDHPRGASFKQFVEYMQHHLGDTKTGPGLTRLFELIDTEGKKYIDKDRLRELAKEIGDSVTEDDLDDLIENFFESEDGKVNVDQFYHMMIQDIF